MSTESFSRHTGEERRSRIEDIARGDQVVEQLAEKYGITYQVMRDFGPSHSDVIAAG